MLEIDQNEEVKKDHFILEIADYWLIIIIISLNVDLVTYHIILNFSDARATVAVDSRSQTQVAAATWTVVVVV